MKVFVSSTVFDLVDVRAEVQALLREMGVDPVMSDEKLSSFDATPNASSIETCLINVDASDVVIVIVSQRYGPRLGNYGFDDVSATHLEYRRARDSGKPVWFYVRDRTEADYEVHRRNSNAKIRYPWVRPNDLGLFDFIKEHKELRADASSSNWLSAFTSSQDLKEAIRRRLSPAVAEQTLISALRANEFPLFDCTDEIKNTQHTISSVSFFQIVTVKNAGGSVAFNVSAQWEGEKKKDLFDIATPGQSIVLTKIARGLSEFSGSQALTIEYESAIGVTVREVWRAGFEFGGFSPGDLMHGVSLESREFRRSENPVIAISDD